MNAELAERIVRLLSAGNKRVLEGSVKLAESAGRMTLPPHWGRHAEVLVMLDEAKAELLAGIERIDAAKALLGDAPARERGAA